MRLIKFLQGCSLIGVLVVSAFSQYQKVADVNKGVVVMPVSEVREGMRGTARTVFRGSKSEEFNVEILGVVPNWIGPKQDMIIGRLSGANAERTSVFAGMSGSPVYVDGKLVGAISYSFPFAKEPICGITPFDQMTSVVEQGSASAVARMPVRTFSLAELTGDHRSLRTGIGSSGSFATTFPTDSRLSAIAGQTFLPIATPVTFSGVSKSTIDRFSSEFAAAGMISVAATGGGSARTALKPASETTLLGGDSVVVHLSRGDVQIAAAGTVTLRDGEKIYAFGHPFFGLGSANLPMSESHVVTVIPNASNSFKIAVADDMVGTMTQDRATTIYGTLGTAPRMLPIKIKLATSRGRTEEVNFEAAFDEILTPLIVNVGVSNTLQASERGLGQTSVEVTGQITIKGEEPLIIQRRFAGPQATAMASAVAAVPLAALMKANFPGVDITGVDIQLKSVDGSTTAVLDRISADRTQVRAGETIEITAVERTESGILTTRKIPLKIPLDVAPGPLSIMIGDGTALTQISAVTLFTPRTAAELIAMLNKLKRPDRLYAVITRTSNGAVVGASEMPNLPPSMLATINNDRSVGGSKSSVNTVILETEMSNGEYIVTGSHTLAIEVIR
ncbi:MAG: SpoIVB peptidase S55 domain-containing protein [Pyrinomonadaceae bacterium]